jgi:hypothetical protein
MFIAQRLSAEEAEERKRGDNFVADMLLRSPLGRKKRHKK